jgi:hypothetical protein
MNFEGRTGTIPSMARFNRERKSQAATARRLRFERNRAFRLERAERKRRYNALSPAQREAIRVELAAFIERIDIKQERMLVWPRSMWMAPEIAGELLKEKLAAE